MNKNIYTVWRVGMSITEKEFNNLKSFGINSIDNKMLLSKLYEQEHEIEDDYVDDDYDTALNKFKDTYKNQAIKYNEGYMLYGFIFGWINYEFIDDDYEDIIDCGSEYICNELEIIEDNGGDE